MHTLEQEKIALNSKTEHLASKMEVGPNTHYVVKDSKQLLKPLKCRKVPLDGRVEQEQSSRAH